MSPRKKEIKCVFCGRPAGDSSCSIDMYGTNRDGEGNGDVESLTFDDVCVKCFGFLTNPDSVIFILRFGMQQKRADEAEKKALSAVP